MSDSGSEVQKRPYPNSKYRQIPYDLVRELTLATFIIGVIVVILTALFSTPDVPPLSAKQVAAQDPLMFIQTELHDLNQQSELGNYGPPYNHGNGSLQSIGGFSPQTWSGVQMPINSANDLVIHPLERVVSMDAPLANALKIWNQASANQQNTWVNNVQSKLNASSFQGNQVVLPVDSAHPYGPVPELSSAYLRLAESGLLEAAIDGEEGSAPILNRTKSLLLFEGKEDSTYAAKMNMLGSNWGVIKETGNYPGAVWLWYYTLLYQIPPYNSSSAADLLVILTVMVTTCILMFIPFIPGLRSIPRGLGIYKLIWRSHYRELRERRKMDEATRR